MTPDDSGSVATTATTGPIDDDQPGSTLPQLDLRISAAAVTCEGVIQLCYDTTVNPDTGNPASYTRQLT